MAEINVTELIKRFADDGDLDPMDMSGSIAEHGNNASQITWNNCLELASEDTAINREILRHTQDIRDYFREYGAWSEDEINEWTDQKLVAIALQEIAASYREILDTDDLKNKSGRLYQCDIKSHPNFGDWYLYLGS